MGPHGYPVSLPLTVDSAMLSCADGGYAAPDTNFARLFASSWEFVYRQNFTHTVVLLYNVLCTESSNIACILVNRALTGIASSV